MSYQSPTHAACTAHIADLRRERAEQRLAAAGRPAPRRRVRVLAFLRRQAAPRPYDAHTLVLLPTRCAPHS